MAGKGKPAGGGVGGGGLGGGLGAALTVALWFCINVGITLLNPVLVVKYGFHFPVFLTTMHMAMTTVLANAAVLGFGMAPRQGIASAGQLAKIGLLAAVLAGGVVCGIWQAKYIPVSFEQTVSATTPLFTAGMALLFQLPPESPRTYVCLVPVVGGLALASGYEPLFHWAGFWLAIAATASRALRSVLQQVLISGDVALAPLNLLRFIAPIAFCLLLPAACYIEGWGHFTGSLARGGAQGAPQAMAFWIVVSCCSAFLVNLFNNLVTKCTSAITLQVCGNAKGAAAALISIPLFGKPVSLMSLAGLVVTISGVMLYSESKRREGLARGKKTA